MNQQENIYSILGNLENPNHILIESEIEALIEGSDNRSLTTYFIDKINKQSPSVESVLNIINNLSQADGKINFVDHDINEILVWFYLENKKPEYLEYCLPRDIRKSRSLVSHFGQALSMSTVPEKSIINLIDRFCSNSQYNDKYNIYFEIFRTLDIKLLFSRTLIFLDEFSPKMKYEFLIRSLKEHDTDMFITIRGYFGFDTFFEYVQSRLNDYDELSLAVRNSIFGHLILNKSRSRDCFLQKSKDIPLTMEYFFNKTLQHKNGYALIYLAEFMDKRKIIKAISSLEDNSKYFDMFFAKYKESSDIKNLLPFI